MRGRPNWRLPLLVLLLCATVVVGRNLSKAQDTTTLRETAPESNAAVPRASDAGDVKPDGGQTQVKDAGAGVSEEAPQERVEEPVTAWLTLALAEVDALRVDCAVGHAREIHDGWKAKQVLAGELASARLALDATLARCETAPKHSCDEFTALRLQNLLETKAVLARKRSASSVQRSRTFEAMGDLFAERGAHLAAASLFKQALAQHAASGVTAGQIPVRIRYVDALVQGGDFDNARDALKGVLASERTAWPVLMDLLSAEIDLSAARPRQAYDRASRALRTAKARGDSTTAIRLGRVLAAASRGLGDNTQRVAIRSTAHCERQQSIDERDLCAMRAEDRVREGPDGSGSDEDARRFDQALTALNGCRGAEQRRIQWNMSRATSALRAGQTSAAVDHAEAAHAGAIGLHKMLKLSGFLTAATESALGALADGPSDFLWSVALALPRSAIARDAALRTVMDGAERQKTMEHLRGHNLDALVHLRALDVASPTRLRALRPNEPLVRQYVASMFHKDGRGDVVPLGEATAIDREIAALRRASSNASRSTDAPGRRLFNTLLAPWVGRLARNARVALWADGALEAVPFDTLPMVGGAVLDQLTLRHITRIDDLASAPGAIAGRERAHLLAMLSPDYRAYAARPKRDGSTCRAVRALPGTAAEGEALIKLWPGRPDVHAHGTATEWHYFDALEQGHPVAIHFATHGVFATPEDEALCGLGETLERPFSAVVLAPDYGSVDDTAGVQLDGLLTAEEIEAHRIDGVRMVVLSACDTNQGRVLPGVGMFGLRSAFLRAGARAVVSSLWQLDDRASALWMAHFYRALLDEVNPKTFSEAARTAAVAIRRRYPHPYYWGAFVVHGADELLFPTPRAPQQADQERTAPVVAPSQPGRSETVASPRAGANAGGAMRTAPVTGGATRGTPPVAPALRARSKRKP